MRRIILCAVVLSACLSIVVPAEAGITKSLFSEQSGSIGLQVTLFQSDPDYAQLTFVNHPIDGAILNDAPAGGDPSIGWDVIFGPLFVDRTSRFVNGAFAEYTLLVPVGQTLTVMDGINTRLSGTISVGTLYTKLSGNFGGMDALKGLTVNSINDGGSAVFQEYAKYAKLDWGFGYSGLNLDAWLVSPPAYSGYAASSGYIMVPEPASLALMGLGGLATFVARRRRK